METVCLSLCNHRDEESFQTAHRSDDDSVTGESTQILNFTYRPQPNSILKAAVLRVGLVFHSKNCGHDFTGTLFRFASIYRHDRLSRHSVSDITNSPVMRRSLTLIIFCR